GLTVYLVDSEYYFGDKIYRGGSAEVEQYAFFQRAVLEMIPMLDFQPEVLHCNDWHTAALPFLLKTQYRSRPQGALKTVLTIHNLAFQGWLSFESAQDLFGIDSRWFALDGLGHRDYGNLLKAGCLFADRVNTVSPSYADEIRRPDFGEGLDGVLRARGGDVSGILNGLDTDSFDPATDPAIPFHYDAADTANKRRCKEALIDELGLKIGPDTPIVAMVTRMTSQKGFDLVLSALDALLERDLAFVLLGSGDAAYQDAMRNFERRYPGRVCAWIGYSEPLSRRIYAGADFLLMPSAFEPCGLSQLIAQRYGTLPVVHEVGGLRDTVRPYNRYTGEGDGFSFRGFSAWTMLSTLNAALDTYYDKAAMAGLMRQAMTKDMSLRPCAVEYGLLFVSILPDGAGRLLHLPYDTLYRSPFGAVKCSQRVTLRLQAPDYVEAELSVNGKLHPMHRDADGLLSARITAPPEPGLVHYVFHLPGDLRFGRDGLVRGEARPWRITVYDGAFATPDWAEGTVLYQIFPDRYAPGGESFQRGVRSHRRRGRRIETHKSWDEPVKYLAGEGEPKYIPNDFYGGTLQGIAERLPELKALGVGCIYCNPIFESSSNHRYNTGDYHKVDPMLGTNEDFRALCAAAAEAGIRVILDGVFSHTGADSVYFNRYGRYPDLGAYQSQESPYYSWYDFRAFPDDYRCWWNFRSLPEVNEGDESWQNFVIHGKQSVLRRWLRAGAGGWRLDVADELPDETIELMRESLKAEDPQALLLGEVWEDATDKVSYGVQRSYALGRGLDSVMNYPLRAAVLDFLLARSRAEQLRDFLLEQKLNYPAPMYRCLMNLMGSHDTARLRSVLGSGVDGEGMDVQARADFRLDRAQRKWGRRLQRLAAAIQFTLPGMPAVYYGDEEGMEGLRDPFCRAPYRRAGEGDSLRDFYAELAARRAGSKA
ncbi:MAG: glycogen/starch synthase, partial [Oscillospiraceae bacterium]|nr:glycogen/starch synthase [Oscillospiraceae bacterium]